MEGIRQKQQRPSVLRQVSQAASRRQHGTQTPQCPQLHISDIIILHENHFICVELFSSFLYCYVQCAQRMLALCVRHILAWMPDVISFFLAE